MDMGFDDVLGVTNISASGMSAERLRMEVVANNIANASSTRTPDGGPFRRRDLVFASVLGDSQRARSDGAPRLGGVEVVDTVEDTSEPIGVFEPGHPDADTNGMVKYPNVRLPIEMTNLITASRAYEANVRVAQAMKQMMEQSLALIRGGA
jgi:flagellar basal-body rod protein FlgC